MNTTANNSAKDKSIKKATGTLLRISLTLSKKGMEWREHEWNSEEKKLTYKATRANPDGKLITRYIKKDELLKFGDATIPSTSLIENRVWVLPENKGEAKTLLMNEAIKKAKKFKEEIDLLMIHVKIITDMETEKQITEKHGEISWVNEYGNKGVFISLSKPHNPIGGYEVSDSVHSMLISKMSATGLLRAVGIEQHSQTEFGGSYKIEYSDKWLVKGNPANNNITAAELTKEEALNLSYKIIDTIIMDDTIRQISVID